MILKGDKVCNSGIRSYSFMNLLVYSVTYHLHINQLINQSIN